MKKEGYNKNEMKSLKLEHPENLSGPSNQSFWVNILIQELEIEK